MDDYIEPRTASTRKTFQTNDLGEFWQERNVEHESRRELIALMDKQQLKNGRGNGKNWVGNETRIRRKPCEVKAVCCVSKEDKKFDLDPASKDCGHGRSPECPVQDTIDGGRSHAACV